MNKKLKGAGVALVTPFHRDGDIDFKSFEKLINHVIKGGINYVVVLGTTGESVTLTKDEKIAVKDFTVEAVDGRVPVVLGLGGNNTQEIINCINSSDFEGIEAILSVSPYYNKPSQRGLYQHFKSIAGASPVPVILYNVPGRTSSNIKAETTLRLAHEVEGIIGIKEASGNLLQCMDIIKNKPEGFLLISGDDALTLPLCCLGGDGVISVTANGYPKDFSEMVHHSLRGNLKIAREFHYRFIELMDTIFCEGNPSGIKAALEILGICNNHVRLPLAIVSRMTYNKLTTQIEALKKMKPVEL